MLPISWDLSSDNFSLTLIVHSSFVFSFIIWDSLINGKKIRVLVDSVSKAFELIANRRFLCDIVSIWYLEVTIRFNLYLRVWIKCLKVSLLMSFSSITSWHFDASSWSLSMSNLRNLGYFSILSCGIKPKTKS